MGKLDPRVLEKNRDEKEESLYICILKVCSERIPRDFRDPLSSKLWNVAEQHLIYADMLLEDPKKKEANNKAKREASRKVYNKKKKRI